MPGEVLRPTASQDSGCLWYVSVHPTPRLPRSLDWCPKTPNGPKALTARVVSSLLKVKKPEKTRRRRDEAHVASTRRVRFAASGKPHHMLARLPRAHREHSTSHRMGVPSVPPPRSICCSPVLHGRLLADEENDLEQHVDGDEHLLQRPACARPRTTAPVTEPAQ